MQCERAQEYFSDYLERTLDRPMTVALESHLAGCPPCRGEIESLRDLFVAMETIPEVEPPADGAWRVIRAIQEEHVKQIHARRRPARGFFEWLRTLSPGSAAMGAGLATLAVGGLWAATGIRYIPNGANPSLPVVRPAVAPRPASAPDMRVTMDGPTSAGQVVHVNLQATADLPSPQVNVTWGGYNANWNVTGTLSRFSAADFPITLPLGSTSEALNVTVSAGRQTYRYLVVVPLVSQKDQPVSLSLVAEPLDGALRRLAPYLSRPVVVDGGLTGDVRLQVSEQPARQCLDMVAQQVGGTARLENGVYRLAAAH